MCEAYFDPQTPTRYVYVYMYNCHQMTYTRHVHLGINFFTPPPHLHISLCACGHKGCIPLSPSQLRFIARRVWCFGVAWDVQDCDPLLVLRAMSSSRSWKGWPLCCWCQASHTEASWTMTLTGSAVYFAKATSPAKSALAFVW